MRPSRARDQLIPAEQAVKGQLRLAGGPRDRGGKLKARGKMGQASQLRRVK